MAKSSKKTFLSYKGPVYYDTIGDLIGELKEKMFENKVKQATYKKVLMIMIEALENIFKYHECFEKEDVLHAYPPTLKISLREEKFYIKCTNPVRIDHVEQLKGRIDEVNSLDKQGIKEKYKQTITNGKFSEKGGAGLGIIEMAKITDNKLEYVFTKINEKFTEFSLTLLVKMTE